MSKQSAEATLSKSAGSARSTASVFERQHTLGSHICVQREAIGPAMHPGASSLVRDVVGSSGRPLDAATRTYMEPRFGYDFSQVRVHTDERAAESAQAVSANAYTAGTHVVFGAGQYEPGSQSGRRVLAHELTHVIQQANGHVTGTSVGQGLSVSQPSDSFEQRADLAADELLAGPFATGIKPETRSLYAPGFNDRLVVQRQKKKPSQQQATAQAKDNEKKEEAWDLVKLHITPELLTKFQEIGRSTAVDARIAIQKAFAPYDDEISTPDQTFLNILLSGWGNVPQAELGGFLGGAGAAGLQAVITAMLDTQSVAAVKERARNVPEDVLAANLTSDSPEYESFEDGALADLQGEFDSWWQAHPADHDHPDQVRSVAALLQREARARYGANSLLGAKVRKDLLALMDRGLAAIREELDDAQEAYRRKRDLRTAASVGAGAGLLVGGVIGAFAGGAAGAAIGGLIGGVALGGLALGGAAIAQALTPTRKERRARQQQPEAPGPGDYPSPSRHPKEMIA